MVYFLVLKPRDTSKAQHTSQVLNWGQFCTWGTLSNVWEHFFFFLVVIWRGLASSRLSPGMLLNIPKCAEEPPTTQNFMNTTHVDKPWHRLTVPIFQLIS